MQRKELVAKGEIFIKARLIKNERRVYFFLRERCESITSSSCFIILILISIHIHIIIIIIHIIIIIRRYPCSPIWLTCASSLLTSP